MPEIGPEDMKIISEPVDFYCQNIYNGNAVKSDGRGGYSYVPREPGYARTSICGVYSGRLTRGYRLKGIFCGLSWTIMNGRRAIRNALESSMWITGQKSGRSRIPDTGTEM